ncbi:hypothetical protein BDR26DRAFT_921236 [Obelidium mucronatum]|nr:hypothetical protein BDR26DRAFT_921236 [Obelidium mucronatum]
MDLPPMPSAAVITQRKLQEQRIQAAAAAISSENITLGPSGANTNANTGQMSLAVPPSVLSAVSNNTDANIVAQLCGFDPFDLLNTVDFPNDRFERLLRVSKDARQLALRREEIPIEELPEEESNTLNLLGRSLTPSANHFSRGSNLLTTVLEPTTKFSLDRNEGIKVELVGNQDPSNAVAEAKQKEMEVLKEQLARSAAAITIQSFIRGFLIRRKFIAVVYAKLTIDSHDTDTSKVVGDLPPVIDLNIQERVLRKFKNYVRIFEMQQFYLPDYPHFAAAKIQATFRMCIFRKKWKFIQALSVEEKNGHLGREAKAAMIRKAERADYKTSTYVKAVVKIQIAWRSFAARKVYHFYKNLIQFREAGSPSALLKYVNPKESKLIDTSCGIHVRFRLGGTHFPPTIYYKIFVHHKLVDMNAFSPRDYTKTKQRLPRELFTKGFEVQDREKDGWYQRIENNGWRPIVERNWKEELLDDTTSRTAAKTVRFHHSKLKRQAELEKMKKLKKLQWMKKLYEEGKKLSNPDPPTRGDFNDVIMEDCEDEEDGPLKQQPPPVNTFETEEQLLQAMAELETELEHEFLMKWSEALDFDAYSHDWLLLSTTGKSDEPDGYAAAMADAPLKNFINPTIEVLNQNYSNDLKKKAAHIGVGRLEAVAEADPMMAEIDLFRKLAAETGANSIQDDRRSVISHEKKMRPWSGRSNQSLGGMFLKDF